MKYPWRRGAGSGVLHIIKDDTVARIGQSRPTGSNGWEVITLTANVCTLPAGCAVWEVPADRAECPYLARGYRAVELIADRAVYVVPVSALG